MPKTAILTARILSTDMDQLAELVGSNSVFKSKNDAVKEALRLWLDAQQAKTPTAKP